MSKFPHFSLAGAYHCVGKQFALQEMRMVIATIVHKYDMAESSNFDTDLWESSIEDRGLIEIHKPLSVTLKKRTQ